MADKIDEKRRASDKASGAEKKKKPPLAVIGAVVGVVVLMAAFMVGKQVSAKSRPGGKVKVEAGPVMPLEDFIVNLADPGGDHFLKITVNLELSKAKGKTPEDLKEKVPQIRDAVIMTLSDKERDSVTPTKGREKLKDEIKKQVNASLGESDVQEVYFTNFVTQ